MQSIYIIVAFLLYSMSAYGWSGYDWSKGSYIDIEEGELVREGEEITIFNYGSDSGYKNIEVISIERNGDDIEIEGIDVETGENRTFEMD